MSAGPWRREVGGPVRVCDLVPGDLVAFDGPGDASATLLGWSTPHPGYPGRPLAMVLWQLHHEDGFSVDALHPEQVVGVLRGRTDAERFAAVVEALPYPGVTG